ncbi:MAG: DHA1 family bicyclomycin/chloramphenicol resistance-like MFS transporter [Halioglobus sp.]|jgi:DHA1 family bicyclomycin/chloramphenicol resistance-like MFS transporter
MPDLVRWFDTTATKVKLTISLNVLAFGLAQLIHGPLSDRYGRRPVLLVSLGIVCLLCLACASAQTIDQLIVARVLLGIAAAAEAVVGLAIIKDLYSEKQQVKALALIGMVIAITPAAAPILGGYIHVAWGWQANFIVISAMAAVALLFVAWLLPESTTPDPSALKMSVVTGRYKSLLRNSDFMIHSALLGVTLGLLFVFVTAAPFVLIDLLGVPPDKFGFYQASIVLAFFLGSVLASRLADHWEPFRLMSLGVVIVLVGSILLSIVILGGKMTPYSLAASFMVMTFGMGPLFAVAPSRALRSVESNAGSASAMLNGIEQTTAGVAAVFISVFHDGSARPMALVTMLLALLLLGLVYRSKLEDRVRIGE